MLKPNDSPQLTDSTVANAQSFLESPGPLDAGTSTNFRNNTDKPKRFRVSELQLVQLERFYMEDKSPHPTRRKEISDILGMSQRQTQVWFQNRRSKERNAGESSLYTRRNSLPMSAPSRTRRRNPSTPLESTLQSQPSSQVEEDKHLLTLLAEHSRIVVIPSTSLQIGTWKRLVLSEHKYGLVTYVCPALQWLAWYIHNNALHFKMRIPFKIISKATFEADESDPQIGTASIFLSEPPTFLIERPTYNPETGERGRAWNTCADWTANQQASQVLVQRLTGPFISLAHLVRCVNEVTRKPHPVASPPQNPPSPNDHSTRSPAVDQPLPGPIAAPVADLTSAYPGHMICHAPLATKPGYMQPVIDYQLAQCSETENADGQLFAAQQQYGENPNPICYSSGGYQSNNVYEYAYSNEPYTMIEANGHGFDASTPTYRQGRSLSVPNTYPPGSHYFSYSDQAALTNDVSHYDDAETRQIVALNDIGYPMELA
ncbi:homeobox-domain-containing protein [Coprinopsis marcescibilis]|uniref:Homeobox-domain-containing protein n=1 Tax=Coprinopsis marcescibilis TaxID=230819 RepID=A0A5C3L5Z7_COPMA|nr:homeobox-domain-containing protein [Coprinopsis marcescibilis]